MEQLKNKYYIRLNENNKIIKTFSNIFEEPQQTDVLIGEGYGSQFRATSEILSEGLQEYSDVENGLPLYDLNGNLQLIYENNLIRYTTDEEKQQELEAYQQTDTYLRGERTKEFDTLVDKYQLVLKHEELTEQQKQELKDYRQAWLDVTVTKVIPTRPTWLI